MTSSLVGSEMCIRDRHISMYPSTREGGANMASRPLLQKKRRSNVGFNHPCLLYTSDAADDM
eukprot:7798819-Prorocentrum_lima.AAC.1